MTEPKLTLAEVDARLAINRVRWVGAKARGAVEDALGYRHRLDQLLDQRLALMGIGACGCGSAKSTFGTAVGLCPRCDFRTCQGCAHQVISLTAVRCPCGDVS